MQARLTSEELDLLGLILEKEELQPFFFRKAKGLKWFDALVERKLLSPEKNPKPVPAKEEGYIVVPLWPATEYLVATSPDLQQKKNEPYAGKFLNLIRSTTNHAKESNFSNYRTWWQFSKIIQNIPPGLITLEDLKLIEFWLDDPYEHGLIAIELGGRWVDALLDRNDPHSHELALGALSILYKVHIISTESERKRRRASTDEWYEKQITNKVASKAGKTLGIAVPELFKDRLEQFLAAENTDKWSSVWRHAIEDHEQDQHRTGFEHVMIDGFRDSLLACADAHADATFDYVGRLLGSPYQTVRRIAIFAIDHRYRQLRDLAQRILDPGYFTSNYRHELWHLLKNHYESFSRDQKRAVARVISDHIERDESTEQVSDRASAYWRAIWYAALMAAGSSEADLYRKAVETAGAEPEHPDFSSYVTTRWGGRGSPRSPEQLLSLELDDLIDQLNSFKDSGGFFEPGLEGLAKTLKEAVKTQPLRFYRNLGKFLTGDFAYIYNVIEAYHELWSTKVPLPWDDVWGNLLALCGELIAQTRFWEPEAAKSRTSFVANRHWIVGGIARLIEAGTKSDEHAFDERLLDQAERILTTLLRQEKGEEFKSDSDAVSIAINGPRGRCLEALINLTLRSCRLSDKKIENHAEVWAHFQEIYDSELGRAEEFEFVTLVSMYLPNFLYMSQDWVVDNLARIFEQRNKLRWRCAMQGYAYVNQVYEVIYRYLKENGDVILALNDESINSRVQEKLVQHIAVGYLNGHEELDDDHGLMAQLVARSKESELGHLIWFIWTLRDSEQENIRSKVFLLWSRLVKAIDTTTKEGRRLAARLCDWISFVRVVDETNKNLILAVALYSGEYHHSFAMLESIARISKKQPSEAFEIWDRLLQNSAPSYPGEAIRETLTNLVAQGNEGGRKAKKIVDKYLKAGNEEPEAMLREAIRAGHPTT